jgi:hypothetical protein
MPTDVKEFSAATQEQVLKAIEATQAAVLDGVRAWSKTVESVVPASLPKFDIPGVEALPSPKEAVALGFDFAEKLLSSQKTFADQLVSALTPAS